MPRFSRDEVLFIPSEGGFSMKMRFAHFGMTVSGMFGASDA